MTDGTNEDANSIGLEDLLGELKRCRTRRGPY